LGSRSSAEILYFDILVYCQYFNCKLQRTIATPC
jgi:hypothetical protein